MNKLFTKIATLLVGSMMAIGVGVAIGSNQEARVAEATEVTAYSLTPYAVDKGNTDYTKTGVATVGGISWTIGGNVANSPWRIGGKKSGSSTENVNRAMYSQSAINEDVTKIVVTIGNNGNLAQANYKTATLIVSTAADGGGTVISSIADSTFAKGATLTFEKPNDKSWDNRYYKIVFNIDFTSTNNCYFEFSSATFYKESTGPVVEWVDHPSSGYTGVDYEFSASATGIENELWDWTVSPSAGVTKLEDDGDAVISFENTGTYTVTAYCENGLDDTIHASAVQEIVISASSSTLALDYTSATVGKSSFFYVKPTVTNVGSYSNTKVSVSTESSLVTLSGLTDGKVESGSAVTITSKTTTGTAVINFSCNGNNETFTLTIEDIITARYLFTAKTLTYDYTGSDILAYQIPDWNVNLPAEKTIGNQDATRGLAFGAGYGGIATLSLPTDSDLGDYSVRKVTLVASTNADDDVNSIALSVNDIPFELSDESTTYLMKKANNVTIEFYGNECGDLDISINDQVKTVWIKSVELLLENNQDVVDDYAEEYLHILDPELETDEDTGFCRTKDGTNKTPYDKAKLAFADFNDAQVELFLSIDDYADRLYAWAVANEDTFNKATGEFGRTVLPIQVAREESNNIVIVIVIISAVGIASIGMFFFLRKRKDQ